MTTPRTSLGCILAASAEECGSVSALARALGVSRQTLSDLMAGETTPEVATFEAVAKYLDQPLERVLEWHRTPEEGPPIPKDCATGGHARIGLLEPKERKTLAAVGHEHKVAGKERGGRLPLEDAG